MGCLQSFAYESQNKVADQMLQFHLFSLLFISLISISPALAFTNEETLEVYWPIHAPMKSWNLIDTTEKDSSKPKIMMTVINKYAGTNQMDLWFSNKPGQTAETSNVERYEYCDNSGGNPWLFLNTYINVRQGKSDQYHPVRATRILFTPDKGQTIDLIADGTYARCGNKGQPYLLWNQNLDKYHIQVWGNLTENSKWKWYWDATVSKAEPVTNDCLKPAQSVKALKVQEAWWSNFKAAEGKWNLGTGDMGEDGLPTGTNVIFGRTVWHAQGQLPYYLIGKPDGKTVGWCKQ